MEGLAGTHRATCLSRRDMQLPTLWREMDISAGKALSPVEIAHLLSEYKRSP